jgi:hypothetical protein
VRKEDYEFEANLGTTAKYHFRKKKTEKELSSFPSYEGIVRKRPS